MSKPIHFSTPLIETDALAALLGDPRLRLLDATYYIPPASRDARADYQAKHIPGAQFFDIDAIADTQTDLPHMLPSAEVFAERVGQLGIGNDDAVVVYDAHGIMSAPRAWWMFRYFGHDRVAVLNGGLPKWEREGRPLGNQPENPKPAVFKAKPRPELLVSRQQVLESLSNRPPQPQQIIDMRSAGRFEAKEPEPRAGLRAGHIPGSRNLPWASLLDPGSKTFLSGPELRARFEQIGINPAQPVRCTCGSGVTACLGALSLYLLGNENAAVYDGSWAEWGSRPELPIAP